MTTPVNPDPLTVDEEPWTPAEREAEARHAMGAIVWMLGAVVVAIAGLVALAWRIVR